MKIYLAARFSRKEELKGYAEQLRQRGHTVISSWLDTDWTDRPGESSVAPPEYRKEWASRDLNDIDSVDMVISFTEQPGIANAGRGGRHVEFGYALAKGKRLLIVGPAENLFHEHEKVACRYSDFDTLLEDHDGFDNGFYGENK